MQCDNVIAGSRQRTYRVDDQTQQLVDLSLEREGLRFCHGDWCAITIYSALWCFCFY